MFMTFQFKLYDFIDYLSMIHPCFILNLLEKHHYFFIHYKYLEVIDVDVIFFSSNLYSKVIRYIVIYHNLKLLFDVHD